MTLLLLIFNTRTGIKQKYQQIVHIDNDNLGNEKQPVGTNEKKNQRG